MNVIKCSGPGCTAEFRTEEPVSPKATYTCREHTGRPVQDVFFQEVAFDPFFDTPSSDGDEEFGYAWDELEEIEKLGIETE